MGVISWLADTGFGLANDYYQSKSFFDATNEGGATKAYLAKTVENYISGKIDGQETIANGINALVDNKVTTGLYEHLVGDDPEHPKMNKTLASMISKGLGLAASHLAGKMALGLERSWFPPKTSLDSAQRDLEARGQMPDQGNLLTKFISMMSGNTDGIGAPLGGGTGRQSQQGVA